MLLCISCLCMFCFLNFILFRENGRECEQGEGQRERGENLKQTPWLSAETDRAKSRHPEIMISAKSRVGTLS